MRTRTAEIPLWASAFVIAALVLVEAGRSAAGGAHAGPGDFSDGPGSRLPGAFAAAIAAVGGGLFDEGSRSASRLKGPTDRLQMPHARGEEEDDG